MFIISIPPPATGLSLNKEIVRDIINLFTSPKTNPNGAVLVFSTHYTEVIDFLRRSDAVEVCSKTDDGYLEITNLSVLSPRNDTSKASAFLGNRLGKTTAPGYENYKALIERVMKEVNGEPDE